MSDNLFPLALCEFMKEGKVFPIRLGIRSQPEGDRALHWQRQGQGQFDDLQLVAAESLRDMLNDGKIDLSVFTAEAQEQKRQFILSLGKEGEP